MKTLKQIIKFIVHLILHCVRIARCVWTRDDSTEGQIGDEVKHQISLDVKEVKYDIKSDCQQATKRTK